MRLTNYTDFSIRVLIYLAAHSGRIVSTEEISKAYGISNNHLVKVVNNLGHHGFLKVKRGRHGGIMLNRAPSNINLGEVVRASEPDFHLAECFGAGNQCPISEVCGLKGIFNEALDEFMKVFESKTLEDVIAPSQVEAYRSLMLNADEQSDDTTDNMTAMAQ